MDAGNIKYYIDLGMFHVLILTYITLRWDVVCCARSTLGSSVGIIYDSSEACAKAL